MLVLSSIMDNPASYIQNVLHVKFNEVHRSWIRQNLSARNKLAILGRIKLGETIFMCDQGNFNRTTVKSRNPTLVTNVLGT